MLSGLHIVYEPGELDSSSGLLRYKADGKQVRLHSGTMIQKARVYFCCRKLFFVQAHETYAFIIRKSAAARARMVCWLAARAHCQLR